MNKDITVWWFHMEDFCICVFVWAGLAAFKWTGFSWEIWCHIFSCARIYSQCDYRLIKIWLSVTYLISNTYRCFCLGQIWLISIIIYGFNSPIFKKLLHPSLSIKIIEIITAVMFSCCSVIVKVFSLLTNPVLWNTWDIQYMDAKYVCG